MDINEVGAFQYMMIEPTKKLTMTVTIAADATLDEAIEAFEMFLIGVGYSLPGPLVIEHPSGNETADLN